MPHIVSNGADPNILSNDKWSCLLLACYAGHTVTAKYLLEYGAEVNYSDPVDLETSLHKTSRNELYNLNMKELPNCCYKQGINYSR